jgi:hypothetical protein
MARALLAIIVLAPVSAHAGNVKTAILEAVIPDVRYEYSFTESSKRYVLSLPVAWHATHVELGTETALGFIHVGEAQWQGTNNEWRGLLGERVTLDLLDRLSGFGPMVEVSGLLGTDGYGVVLGTGIVWGYAAAGITFGLVGRYVITDNERRADIALDLMLPLNMLDELGGWQ